MVTNNDLPAHRQLSDQQLSDLKTALSAGRSVRAAAGDLGLRYDTSLTVAKGHGWFTPRPHSRATDQQTAKLIDLVNAGTSVRAAAHSAGPMASPLPACPQQLMSQQSCWKSCSSSSP